MYFAKPDKQPKGRPGPKITERSAGRGQVKAGRLQSKAGKPQAAANTQDAIAAQAEANTRILERERAALAGLRRDNLPYEAHLQDPPQVPGLTDRTAYGQPASAAYTDQYGSQSAGAYAEDPSHGLRTGQNGYAQQDVGGSVYASPSRAGRGVGQTAGAGTGMPGPDEPSFAAPWGRAEQQVHAGAQPKQFMSALAGLHGSPSKETLDAKERARQQYVHELDMQVRMKREAKEREKAANRAAEAANDMRLGLPAPQWPAATTSSPGSESYPSQRSQHGGHTAQPSLGQPAQYGAPQASARGYQANGAYQLDRQGHAYLPHQPGASDQQPPASRLQSRVQAPAPVQPPHHANLGSVVPVGQDDPMLDPYSPNGGGGVAAVMGRPELATPARSPEPSPGGRPSPPGRTKPFMASMSELRGGPSDDQRRHAELQRAKLVKDLEEQVRQRREAEAARKAAARAAELKEERDIQAYYERLAQQNAHANRQQLSPVQDLPQDDILVGPTGSLHRPPPEPPQPSLPAPPADQQWQAASAAPAPPQAMHHSQRPSHAAPPPPPQYQQTAHAPPQFSTSGYAGQPGAANGFRHSHQLAEGRGWTADGTVTLTSSQAAPDAASSQVTSMLQQLQLEQVRLREQFAKQAESMSRMQQEAETAARERDRARDELARVQGMLARSADSLDEFVVDTQLVPANINHIPPALPAAPQHQPGMRDSRASPLRRPQRAMASGNSPDGAHHRSPPQHPDQLGRGMPQRAQQAQQQEGPGRARWVTPERLEREGKTIKFAGMGDSGVLPRPRQAARDRSPQKLAAVSSSRPKIWRG